MKTSKGAPRLLPTLTEVVKPKLAASSPAAAHAALVAQIMETVLPQIEEKLCASLENVLQRQLSELPDTVRKEVELAVKKSFAQQTGTATHAL